MKRGETLTEHIKAEETIYLKLLSTLKEATEGGKDENSSEVAISTESDLANSRMPLKEPLKRVNGTRSPEMAEEEDDDYDYGQVKNNIIVADKNYDEHHDHGDNGEDDDPIDDWASTDLSKLNDKGEDNVSTSKDKREDKPIRSRATQTKKKKDAK